MGFLKEERRLALKNRLINEYGCPEHIAEAYSSISDGNHDRHLWCHAQICVEFNDKDHLYFQMSAAVMEAIAEEAQERGMGPADFPHAYSFMKGYIRETHQ